MQSRSGLTCLACDECDQRTSRGRHLRMLEDTVFSIKSTVCQAEKVLSDGLTAGQKRAVRGRHRLKQEPKCATHTRSLNPSCRPESMLPRAHLFTNCLAGRFSTRAMFLILAICRSAASRFGSSWNAEESRPVPQSSRAPPNREASRCDGARQRLCERDDESIKRVVCVVSDADFVFRFQSVDPHDVVPRPSSGLRSYSVFPRPCRCCAGRSQASAKQGIRRSHAEGRCCLLVVSSSKCWQQGCLRIEALHRGPFSRMGRRFRFS